VAVLPGHVLDEVILEPDHFLPGRGGGGSVGKVIARGVEEDGWSVISLAFSNAFPARSAPRSQLITLVGEKLVSMSIHQIYNQSRRR